MTDPIRTGARPVEACFATPPPAQASAPVKAAAPAPLDSAEKAPKENPMCLALQEKSTCEPEDGVAAAPPEDPAAAHDRAVQAKITEYIDQVNSLKHADTMTVAEKLDAIAAKVIGDREGDSTNTVLRDVDYYFAARKTLAADDNLAAKFGHDLVGTVATGLYNGLKTVTMPFSDVMRTDKEHPNSPPGGFLWEQRGAVDGYPNDGDQKIPLPNYRKNLD